MLKVHEENIYVHSGLRTKERRKEGYEKYWKEGWIEEVELKLSSREIEVTKERKNT